MFCVFGRSRFMAIKYMDKKIISSKSELSIDLAKCVTQSDKQRVLDIYVDDYFKVIPIRKCSHELSTPTLAKELLNLMNKEPSFSDLKIMKKRPKVLKSGKKSVSKTTGKSLMEWVDLSEV